jgi:hypothetical protein
METILRVVLIIGFIVAAYVAYEMEKQETR